MKQIFLTSLLLIALIACRQQSTTFEEKFSIHTVTKYLVNNDDKIIRRVYYRELDKNQNTILEIFYNDDGSKIIHTKNFIGDREAIEIIQYYNSQNILDSQNTNVIYFNLSRKIDRTLLLDSHGDTSRIVQFFYDSQGNLTLQQEFIKRLNYSLKTEINYEYLPNGNLSKIVLINNIEPKKKIIEVFTYQIENQCISKLVLDETNSTKEIVNYKYNSLGLIVEEVHNFPSGNLEKYKYFYTFY